MVKFLESDEKMTMIRYENGDNPWLIHKGTIEKLGLDTMNNPQKSISGVTIILSLNLYINFEALRKKYSQFTGV
jgi:hypothetical protein